MSEQNIKLSIIMEIDRETAEAMASSIEVNVFSDRKLDQDDLIILVQSLQKYISSRLKTFGGVSGYVQFRVEGTKVPAIRREIHIEPLIPTGLPGKKTNR